MINITDSAAAKLKALILEHPDDPIVRISMKDHSETQIKFSIVLESNPQPEDEVFESNGLTLAIDQHTAARIGGVTVDYKEPKGFSFQHPEEEDEIDILKLINPN